MSSATTKSAVSDCVNVDRQKPALCLNRIVLKSGKHVSKQNESVEQTSVDHASTLKISSFNKVGLCA